MSSIVAEAPTKLWKTFLWAAWYTGLRRNELLELHWDECARPWIDFRRKRIQLPAAWNKSDEDQWIPLHPDLAKMLAKCRKDRGLIFPLSKSPPEVSRRFSLIARAAGIKLTLHDIRRSFGTRYAAHVPAQVLQRLMRHADIKTTMAFYCDVDGALDEAILKC